MGGSSIRAIAIIVEDVYLIMVETNERYTTATTSSRDSVRMYTNFTTAKMCQNPNNLLIITIDKKAQIIDNIEVERRHKSIQLSGMPILNEPGSTYCLRVQHCKKNNETNETHWQSLKNDLQYCI